MSKPPTNVRGRMEATLDEHGLTERLGDALFPPEHWHQSLSGIHEDTPGMLETLMQVGNAINAESALMRFDHIGDSGGRQWSFLPRNEPGGFSELISEVRRSMSLWGLDMAFRNRPQVPISYRAPEDLRPVEIDSIDWKLDRYTLVRRRRHPFGYDTLKEWRL
ncbi:hypothetical protein [uncultured Abyssibacter sp.]|uniref:hypothetical protein n=1 Tax=uncultured Abyssibacter sp. TaxID=2320202 RepID=UPI0032B24BF4